MANKAPTRNTDPIAPSHDVLALIADVERTIGTLRERAGDEVQRANEEAARLSRDLGALETERLSLINRQMSLAAELAAERGARDTDRDAFASQLASARDAFEADLASARTAFESDLSSARTAFDTDLASARAQFESELAAARADASALESRLKDAEQSTVAMHAEFESRVAATRAEVASLNAMLAAARDAGESERTRLAGELEAAHGRVAEWESRFHAAAEAAAQSRDELEEQLFAAEERVKLLDARVADAENAIAVDRARVKTVERRSAEQSTAFAARIAELEAALAGQREGAQSLAGTLSSRAEELAALEAQLAARTQELAAAQVRIDELAAAVETNDETAEEIALEFANDHAQLEETVDSLRNELVAREAALDEARAQAAEAFRRVAALEEEIAVQRSAHEQGLHEAGEASSAGLAAIADLRQHVAFRDERIAQLDEALALTRTRMAELEGELAARRDEAAALANTVRALESRAAAEPAASFDAEAMTAEIEARAAAIADSKAEAAFASQQEQLNLAASFIRHRYGRLVNLHKGIKAKARRVRDEKARVEAMRAAAPTTTVDPSTIGFPGHDGPVTSFDETRVAAERSALTRERKEIAELRAVLASSEEALRRRATGISSIGTAAASIFFLGCAAAASWHIAGFIATPPAIGSMEFATTTQGTEGRQVEADATPVATWLKDEIRSPGFSGLVASRLNERGRSYGESSAMVADLASRLKIEPQGTGTVRLSIAEQSADQASATIDAVMSTVIYQANRDPARASDGLRIGHANARNSSAGIPQPKIEVLPDAARLARSGVVFGVLGAVGVGLGFVRYRAGRRASHGVV